MQVIFYSGFVKKLNSTKRPSSGGTTKTVRLKENTSIKNPVFILNENNFAYNYVQYGATYYFINDIVSINNSMAEYHCSIDILATFKDAIGAAQLMVVRADSNYDGSITDVLYPAKTDIVVRESSGTPIWDTLDPTFIISTVNKSGPNKFGLTSYYALDTATLEGFADYLFDYASYGSDTSEISESLFKSLFNPIQYVQTTKCIPLTAGTIGGTYVDRISFGWWKFEIPSWSASSPAITGDGVNKHVNITLPKHPQASSRGSYLNAAPYSEYVLDFRPFGVFPLDSQKLIEASSIQCEVNIDISTGIGTLNVYADSANGNLITTASADCAVDIALAQFSKNQVAAQAQTASNVSSAWKSAMKLDVGGAVAGTLNSVNSAYEAQVPEYVERGVNGGFVSFAFPPKIHAKFYRIVDEDRANLGRPCCKKLTISSLSGYVQTMTGEIDSNADEEEKQIINNYLTGGFYYE